MSPKHINITVEISDVIATHVLISAASIVIFWVAVAVCGVAVRSRCGCLPCFEALLHHCSLSLADGGHGGTPASEPRERVGVKHARDRLNGGNGHGGIRTTVEHARCRCACSLCFESLFRCCSLSFADSGHGGTPASEPRERVGVKHARDRLKGGNGHGGIRTTVVSLTLFASLPVSNPYFVTARLRSQTAGMVGFEPTIEQLGTARPVH